jgi:phosphotransferase system HPr (HPr) family protein
MPESCDESIVLPVPLHARPAGALVRAVAPFDAAVEIGYGDRAANARSILNVLALGASAGSTVVVRATGPDAAAAIKAALDVLATAE